MNTVTSENFRLDWSGTHLAIGSYLLALLVLLLTSLATLLGKLKRVLLILNLVFGILGFLEFLIFSALLLSFSRWGGRVTEIHTSGPGFWLMLSGFPLCIGSSIIAEHLLSRLRPTVIESPDGLPEYARDETNSPTATGLLKTSHRNWSASCTNLGSGSHETDSSLMVVPMEKELQTSLMHE